MTTPQNPKILLAENVEGDGFCVSLLPPPVGPGHDRCFANYLGARAYARLLKFGNGWELIDRVDTKTRKAAEEADLARRNG
jgi:hypothetical protein